MMRPHKSKFLAAALTCVVLLVAAGCSSGSSSSTTTTTSSGSGSTAASGSGKTYTIGVLTDQTGLAASEFATALAGVKAGIGAAAAQGYHFKYVVGDTGTNPSQALTAAQTMVEQDHVFAVLALSSLTFSAAPYLTSQHIPVVGGAFDGSEWLEPQSTNMFSVMGNLDFTKVTTTFGVFMKSQGVTNVGTLGYSVSPSSAAAARAEAASAQHAGLKAGYVNDSFPFGSTNVAPVALAMKSAGVDAVAPGVDPNTGFALLTALKQDGVHIKVPYLATGYGVDILNAGAPAIAAAQGSYFLSYYEPVEMNTTATRAMQAAFAKYAGQTEPPDFAQYLGYLSVLAVAQGLNGAGANPTQASLITSLSHITNYSAAGLWGGNQTVNWSQRAMGSKQCYYMTKFSGKSFELVPGADPVCGTVIPGASV